MSEDTQRRRFAAHECVARRAARAALRRHQLHFNDLGAATNAALLALWQAAGRFDPATHALGEAGFPRFASTCCRCAVIDHLRREGPRGRRGQPRGGPPAVSLEDAAPRSGGDSDLGIADQAQYDPAERAEVLDLVETACRRLGRREGQVMRLIAGGLNQAAAAAAVGVCQSTVSQIVKRSLPLMREALAWVRS